MITRDLGDYLWVPANGIGPLKTIDGVHRVPKPIPALVALAQRYTGTSARPVAAVMDAADAELPGLTALIESTTP